MNWTFLPATEFDACRDAWGRLNAAGANTPLLSPDFVAPLLRHFADCELSLAIAGDAADPQAMLLLARLGGGRWETFQPSQAPLGLVVAKPGVDRFEFGAGLLKRLPGFGTVLSIQNQDPLFVARPEDRGTLRTLDYVPTAAIDIRAPFDEYWQTCDKKMRDNVRWRRNRLRKKGIETRLEVLTAESDMARGVADFGRIESAGWKGEQGTAVHAENAQGRYYTEMLEAFARRGEARVYRYFLDGELAATDLCIGGDGVLIVLKITYDEAQRTHGPNVLLREAEFRDVFDAGAFRRIEFYGRVRDWHTKWTDDVRTLFHVTCYRWGALRRVWQAVKTVRNRARTPVEAGA